MKRKPCWYHTLVVECPVCGRAETSRERRDGERPADFEARRQIITAYDWCEG